MWGKPLMGESYISHDFPESRGENLPDWDLA